MDRCGVVKSVFDELDKFFCKRCIQTIHLFIIVVVFIVVVIIIVLIVVVSMVCFNLGSSSNAHSSRLIFTEEDTNLEEWDQRWSDDWRDGWEVNGEWGEEGDWGEGEWGEGEMNCEMELVFWCDLGWEDEWDATWEEEWDGGGEGEVEGGLVFGWDEELEEEWDKKWEEDWEDWEWENE